MFSMYAQSCLTLCDLMDYSPLGSSVMEFPGQEYWSGLPFPSPGDLPNPGIEPLSQVSPALTGGFFTTAPPGKPTQLDQSPPLPWGSSYTELDTGHSHAFALCLKHRGMYP